MSVQKRKPVHEIRVRNIKAAIWANRSETSGTWHCVTFARIYKAKGNWKRTSGFGMKDLASLKDIVDEAANWIQQNAAVATVTARVSPDMQAQT